MYDLKDTVYVLSVRKTFSQCPCCSHVKQITTPIITLGTIIGYEVTEKGETYTIRAGKFTHRYDSALLADTEEDAYDIHGLIYPEKGE